MVVQQDKADIYPPDAEGLSELLPETDCGKCGFGSCIEYAEMLIKGQANASTCPDLDSEYAKILGNILKMNKDPIPYSCMMEEEPCTLIEINNPGKGSPLIVTSNFRETVRIMKEIFESTGMSVFLLPTFTHGYSVDNAVHERMFKATEVWKAIKENGVEGKVGRTVLVIPGLAEKEKNSIRQITGWEVLVGPVSGFLAPLFILNNRDALL